VMVRPGVESEGLEPEGARFQGAGGAVQELADGDEVDPG